MAIAASLGGSALSFGFSVLTQLCVYIKHKRRRVIDLVEDFQTLENEVRHLASKLQDQDDKIEHHSVSLQKNHQYDVWSEKVKTVRYKFQVTSKLYTDMCGDVKYQNSLESNPEMKQKKIWTRQFFKLARLDKEVVKLVLDVGTLRKELSFEELTRPAAPEKVRKLAAEEVDIDGHPHKKYLDKLLEFIDEEECKVIGIHGMPGVGITNIMKNLNNFFLSPPSSRSRLNFDYVIWVTIEEGWTSERVQKEIIGRLKAPAGETKQQRSDIISSKLEKKKYLLLLDNVVESIKMEDVGDFKLHDQGKMVLATTRINGLRRVEDLDREIKVETLSLYDSRYMFRQFFVEELSNVEKDVVDRILKELGGFPKCIKLMAKRLRKHRNLMIWQGLKQRMESNVEKPESIQLGGLNHFFEVAYEELGDKQKKCLLYATLYPKHYMIPQNYLVECWEAENFLTAPLTKADGALVINELEERWLLEKSCEKKVKMPVMFREMAINLRLPEQGSESSTVKFYLEKDVHGTKIWCPKAKWISGTQSKIESLPASPECVGLSSLLLQKNPKLVSIADTFFTQMHNLLVLDLHCTKIESLPPSISSLIALRCLYLNGCRCLVKLPAEIVDLKCLEVLDIRNTPVHCSPEEMSHLLRLKCLRISYRKGHGILMQPSHLWCPNLEHLSIEFAKEDNQEADQVKEKVKTCFKDSFDFEVNKDSEFVSFEFCLKRDSSGGNRCIVDPSNYVSLATNSPSTSRSKGNHNQTPLSGNISLNQLSDNISASARGKAIVEE